MLGRTIARRGVRAMSAVKSAASSAVSPAASSRTAPILAATRAYSIRTNPHPKPFSLTSPDDQRFKADDIKESTDDRDYDKSDNEGAVDDEHEAERFKMNIRTIPPEVREPEEQVNLTFDPHMQYRWDDASDYPFFINDLGANSIEDLSHVLGLAENATGHQWKRDVDYSHPTFGRHAYHTKRTQARQRREGRLRRRFRKVAIERRIAEALAVHPKYATQQENLIWNQRIFGRVDVDQETIEAYYEVAERHMANWENQWKGQMLKPELPSTAKSLKDNLRSYLQAYDTVAPTLSREDISRLAAAESQTEITQILARAAGLPLPNVSALSASKEDFVAAAKAEASSPEEAAARVRLHALATLVNGIRERVLAIDAELPWNPEVRAEVATPVIATEKGSVAFTETDLSAVETAIKQKNAKIEVRDDDHLIEDVNHPARGDALFALHRLTKMPPIPPVTASELGKIALVPTPDVVSPSSVLREAAAEARLAYDAVAKAASDPEARAILRDVHARPRGAALGRINEEQFDHIFGNTDDISDFGAAIGLTAEDSVSISSVPGEVLDRAIRIAQSALMQEYMDACVEAGEAVPQSLSPNDFDPRKHPAFNEAFPDARSAGGFRAYVEGIDRRMRKRVERHNKKMDDSEREARAYAALSSADADPTQIDANAEAELAAQGDEGVEMVMGEDFDLEGSITPLPDAGSADVKLSKALEDFDAAYAKLNTSLSTYARVSPDDMRARAVRALRPNEFAESSEWATHSVMNSYQLRANQTHADVALAEYRANEGAAQKHDPKAADLIARIVDHHNSIAASSFIDAVKDTVPDAMLQAERLKDRAVYSKVAPKVRRGVSRAIHQRVAADMLAQGFDPRHVEKMLREYRIDYGELVQDNF